MLKVQMCVVLSELTFGSVEIKSGYKKCWAKAWSVTL